VRACRCDYRAQICEALCLRQKNDLNDAEGFCTALRASDLFLESIGELQFRLMALIIFEIETVGDPEFVPPMRS
jgi:hypothetical protein